MATSRLRPGDTVSVNSVGEAALDGPDRHAERVAQQAQAESAARRARMTATPGSAAPAATAQAVERATPSVASRATSALRGAGSMAASGGKTLARTAGKVAAPIALGMTAADVGNTSTSDYARRFGSEDGRTPASIQGTALRAIGMPGAAGFMDDVQLRTAGAATDLVNTVGMGAFTPLMRDKASPATPAIQGGGTGSAPTPAAGTDPNEVIGTAMGRPITRAQSDALSGRLRTTNGPVIMDANGNFAASTATGAAVPTATQAQASPLRRPDLGGSYAAVGDRSGEVNKQFDDLAKQIQDLHGGARFQARGSLATKLLRLGEMRADALGQNQGALVGQQSNQVRDIDSRRGAEASLYGTDVADRSALRRDTATTAAARVKASADALEARQKANEDALDRTRQQIGDIFTSDKDGNPNNPYGVSSQEVFARLARNPMVAGPDGQEIDFSQADQATRMQLLPSLAADVQMAAKANESALFRTPDSNATVMGVADEDLGAFGALGAVARGAGVGSTLRHLAVPWETNDALVEMSDGSVRFEDDLTKGDADKRSRLRGGK